jgi:hypothetical protein
VTRVVAAGVLAAAVAGCSSGASGAADRNSPPARALVRAPVAMIRTPGWALAACATVGELRRICPGEVPLTRQHVWTMIFSAPSRRFPLALLQLQSCIVWGGFQERVHRPPILGNTVVLGGQFMRLDARAFPTPGARSVVVRNGMANGLRRRPIAWGSETQFAV